jgi:hypothetical protein
VPSLARALLGLCAASTLFIAARPAPLAMRGCGPVVGDSGKSHGAPPRPLLGLWTVEAADAPNPVVADSVVRWLVLRGFDARVVGRFPYRVRVGHFASKRDAMTIARRLLRPGWTPFVIEARE